LKADVAAVRLRSRIQEEKQTHITLVHQTDHKPYYRPVVSKTFSKACDSDNPVPTGLTHDNQRCNAMFCHVTTPRPSDSASQLLASAKKRKKLSGEGATGSEDTTQKYVISEFYPFNRARYDIEEFIEIQVFPKDTKINSFPTMKIIAFTIYSKKLILVVNLYRRPIPANGYFFVQANQRNESFIQTPQDFDPTYKLLPSEDEPVAILLLYNKIDRVTSSEWDSIQLKKRVGTNDIRLTCTVTCCQKLGLL